jgi:hypothetical protein
MLKSTPKLAKNLLKIKCFLFNLKFIFHENRGHFCSALLWRVSFRGGGPIGEAYGHWSYSEVTVVSRTDRQTDRQSVPMNSHFIKIEINQPVNQTIKLFGSAGIRIRLTLDSRWSYHYRTRYGILNCVISTFINIDSNRFHSILWKCESESCPFCSYLGCCLSNL